MKRPKFCVGELVGLHVDQMPDISFSSIEVVSAEYNNGIDAPPYEGWSYWLDGSPYHWSEEALTKLPHDPELSFESVMVRLTMKEELVQVVMSQD